MSSSLIAYDPKLYGTFLVRLLAGGHPHGWSSSFQTTHEPRRAACIIVTPSIMPSV